MHHFGFVKCDWEGIPQVGTWDSGPGSDLTQWNLFRPSVKFFEGGLVSTILSSCNSTGYFPAAVGTNLPGRAGGSIFQALIVRGRSETTGSDPDTWEARIIVDFNTGFVTRLEASLGELTYSYALNLHDGSIVVTGDESVPPAIASRINAIYNTIVTQNGEADPDYPYNHISWGAANNADGGQDGYYEWRNNPPGFSTTQRIEWEASAPSEDLAAALSLMENTYLALDLSLGAASPCPEIFDSAGNYIGSSMSWDHYYRVIPSVELAVRIAGTTIQSPVGPGEVQLTVFPNRPVLLQQDFDIGLVITLAAGTNSNGHNRITTPGRQGKHYFGMWPAFEEAGVDNYYDAGIDGAKCCVEIQRENRVWSMQWNLDDVFGSPTFTECNPNWPYNDYYVPPGRYVFGPVDLLYDMGIAIIQRRAYFDALAEEASPAACFTMPDYLRISDPEDPEYPGTTNDWQCSYNVCRTDPC